MESSKLHDWLQIIGLAAVVGSLVFVGLQLKQADDIALAEVLENTTIRELERRAFTASHADIWRKACLGEDLNAEEQVIAGNLYFSYLQDNLNTWLRYKETGLGGAINPRFLTDSYAANIHRYRGFRQMAEAWEDWAEIGVPANGDLVIEFRTAIFQRIGELQEIEPNPTADVKWCGIR